MPCIEYVPRKFSAESYEIIRQGTLYVEFAHGGAYRYEDVAYQAHAALLEADSVGGYLNEHIKPHHACERVLGDC